MAQENTDSPVPNTVGRATVLRGAVAFKEFSNVSDTYRGQILLDSGEAAPAIIKDVSVRELANEVLAAGLAYALGLQVPRAFIAAASPAELATRHAPKVGSVGLTFASLDVSVPSTGHYVVGPLPARAVARLVGGLLGTAQFGEVYAFDAWAANVDRHPGNLLFDGRLSLWMIDHGHCFTGPNWQPTLLDPDASYRHRLKEWATPHIGLKDRQMLLQRAGQLINRIATLDVRKVGVMNAVPQLLGQQDFEALADFLAGRLVNATRLAADALEIPLVT